MYLDYVKFCGRIVDYKDVDDYVRSAFRVIDRRGNPTFYIKYKDDNGNDDWRECESAMAFSAMNHRIPFRVNTGTAEEPDIEERTMFAHVNRNWPRLCKPYEKLVMKQYLKRDGPPKLSSKTFNTFTGYPHSEMSDEEYDKAMMPGTESRRLFDIIDVHFTDALAAGNPVFDKYQRFWWSYVLRDGWNKVGTSLYYYGKEGSGKGLALVKLMSQGIIGRKHCWVCTNLKRFTGNFSAHRWGKVAIVFNECSDLANGGEWDKLKAIIADDEFVHEAKHKAQYMCSETAAYCFISNWKNAVKLGNTDRRYACQQMSSEKLGDRAYFTKLAEACESPVG